MKIAVLSGKGGAGKTFVSVNLAAAAGKAVYIDCDVEEPNGRLFLKPKHLQRETVYRILPQFDKETCIGCRKCVDFCRFNALVLVKKKPMLFDEVCHSCGGCERVCPAQAVTWRQHPVGTVEIGTRDEITVITGELNIGEASGIPVEQKAMELGFGQEGTVIIDCPPGSACSVMEAVQEADYCVLVAEPTAFGLHNLQMVHELVRILGKPCGCIVNKADGEYEPLMQYCQEQNLPMLCSIPYSEETARRTAAGEIAVDYDVGLKEKLEAVLREVGA